MDFSVAERELFAQRRGVGGGASAPFAEARWMMKSATIQ